MSKTKTQIEKATQEVTGQMPETIKLTRSQSVAITALGNDEARFTQEIKERQALIQRTQTARAEIIGEIAAVVGLPL